MKIEEFMLGNTTMKLHYPEIPKKENLKALYDVINDIAMNLQKADKNITKMFYTKEQIASFRNNKNCIFLK